MLVRDDVGKREYKSTKCLPDSWRERVEAPHPRHPEQALRRLGVAMLVRDDVGEREYKNTKSLHDVGEGE
jgi:hypothetical protein